MTFTSTMPEGLAWLLYGSMAFMFIAFGAYYVRQIWRERNR